MTSISPDPGPPSPAAAEPPRSLRLLSFFSRAIPASFFAVICLSFYMDFRATGRVTSLVWIVSEGLVVVLLVIRRYSDTVSRSARDWLLAIGGSTIFLLVRPTDHALIPQVAGVTLQIAGVLTQIAGKAVLGRSFGVVAANRGLVTSGPYRLIRHPIYLGYLLSHVGFFLSNFSPWNALTYGVGYLLQFGRILVEERVLRTDPEYEAYCGRVRYRLLPWIF